MSYSRAGGYSRILIPSRRQASYRWSEDARELIVACLVQAPQNGTATAEILTYNLQDGALQHSLRIPQHLNHAISSHALFALSSFGKYIATPIPGSETGMQIRKRTGEVHMNINLPFSWLHYRNEMQPAGWGWLHEGAYRSSAAWHPQDGLLALIATDIDGTSLHIVDVDLAQVVSSVSILDAGDTRRVCLESWAPEANLISLSIARAAVFNLEYPTVHDFREGRLFNIKNGIVTTIPGKLNEWSGEGWNDGMRQSTCLSPNGMHLAVNVQQKVEVREVVSGAVRFEISMPIPDPETGEVPEHFSSHDKMALNKLAWSSNSRFLVQIDSGMNDVRILDTATWQHTLVYSKGKRKHGVEAWHYAQWSADGCALLLHGETDFDGDDTIGSCSMMSFVAPLSAADDSDSHNSGSD